MRAYVIVDLGFGDAGKGLLTDFLARHFKAGVVVRYNGGAQAGHNVVTADGRQHTFSQFGSGTFLPDVKTYLSRHVVIHPAALLIEGDILEGKGVRDVFSRLRLSDQALVITPFQQAANRIREIVRGTDRHGSCGVGVGETVEDALLHPQDRLLAGDLANPTRLRRKLRTIREQKYEELVKIGKGQSPGLSFEREWAIFESADVIERWIASIARISELGLVVPDAVLERWLGQTETVIFEGAQGVLLDAEAGFHPYTTWSRCTTQNATELLKELAPTASVFQIGVLRSYAVRHGPGPLPTETNALAAVVSDHNRHNEWQGRVRYGWLDAVLARYALGVVGRLDTLAVTHIDVLPALDKFKYCAGYTDFDDLKNPSVETSVSAGVLKSFRFQPFLETWQRAQLTKALCAVTPLLETCAANEEVVLEKIGALLGQAVGILSRGPTAEHVQLLDSIPQ